MRKLFFLFLVLLFFGCSSHRPKDIMPPAQMKSIMWDLLRADELAEYKGLKDTSLNKWTAHAEYYQQILQIHQVSQNQFRKSLQYYQNHPPELQSIIDSLQGMAEKQKRTQVEKPSYPVDTTRAKKRLNP